MIKSKISVPKTVWSGRRRFKV